MLAFNTQGTRTPIVLVPGIYGTLFVFRHLPRLFGPDQPVYFATDFSAGESSEATPSVESMAATCEAELLEIGKRGRASLAGLSLGALVAFELASRISRKGLQVPLLVSFDGMAPGYPPFLPGG